jgi:hypothetical protein
MELVKVCIESSMHFSDCLWFYLACVPYSIQLTSISVIAQQ